MIHHISSWPTASVYLYVASSSSSGFSAHGFQLTHLDPPFRLFFERPGIERLMVLWKRGIRLIRINYRRAWGGEIWFWSGRGSGMMVVIGMGTGRLRREFILLFVEMRIRIWGKRVELIRLCDVTEWWEYYPKEAIIDKVSTYSHFHPYILPIIGPHLIRLRFRSAAKLPQESKSNYLYILNWDLIYRVYIWGPGRLDQILHI